MNKWWNSDDLTSNDLMDWRVMMMDEDEVEKEDGQTTIGKKDQRCFTAPKEGWLFWFYLMLQYSRHSVRTIDVVGERSEA